MSTYSMLDATGVIVNRIVLDDPATYKIEAGFALVEDADLSHSIGGTIIGGNYSPPVSPMEPTSPHAPTSILAQDLMAQFSSDDAAKIQTAIAANVSFWLLWQSLAAQHDPMMVANGRFKAGWSALVSVLGQARMDAIADALHVTVT